MESRCSQELEGAQHVLDHESASSLNINVDFITGGDLIKCFTTTLR